MSSSSDLAQEKQSIGDGPVTFVIVSYGERNQIARSREAQLRALLTG